MKGLLFGGKEHRKQVCTVLSIMQTKLYCETHNPHRHDATQRGKTPNGPFLPWNKILTIARIARPKPSGKDV